MGGVGASGIASGASATVAMSKPQVMQKRLLRGLGDAHCGHDEGIAAGGRLMGAAAMGEGPLWGIGATWGCGAM
jgi:hypothetical protein